MGTARLLLLSAHAGAPDGLANSSGLVGRRLMVHPGAMVDGYFDDDLHSYRGHFGGQIQSLQFGGTDPDRGFLGGTKWSLAPTGGPLAVAFGLRGRPALGAAHHQHMRERFGRGARWVVLCEDLPDLDNRVELSATLVDGSGIPAPKVTYRLSDDARRATAWSIDRATESLTEAGARTVDGVPMRNNSHLLGTARMGDDRDVLRRRPLGHRARRPQPRDHRRERVRHRRRGQPDHHHLRARAPCRRPSARAARRRPGPRADPQFAAPAVPACVDAGRRPLQARARRPTRRLACTGPCARPRAASACPPPTTSAPPTISSTRCSTRVPTSPATSGARRRDRASTIPPHDLDALRGTDPPAYRALVLAVLAAYYRSPDVQARARLARVRWRRRSGASTTPST